jgi:hypothetical protein
MAMAALVAGTPAAGQERLSFDQPQQVSGIEFVCTGIGSSSRADPRWASYPLRVEVAGADGQFLGNVEIAVERDGAALARVICGGPWILARLDAGAYSVTAGFEGLTTSGDVNVPASGQGRLILRFPESGGAVSPEHVPAPG